ncbi:TraB/GumN family protein [Arenimonas sp.]|uniref:TraB/GumN family protein n=1 Tax=Arenimonas sp. TaxID=1872635 RepID=UPI0039E5D2F9
MKRLFVLGLLGLASACANADSPKPLLWKVSDADNHIYLLGSFHALKPEDYPVAATVDGAFADAERVAFEVSPAEMKSPELARKMALAAMLPEGETLEQQLTPESWRKLQAYADKRQVPLQNYARFEPWFISLIVTLNELGRSGYDGKLGLDQNLMDRSTEAGKPTQGLETADEQIGALDNMSVDEQQQMLAESLEEADDVGKNLDELHRLWRSGDDAGLSDKTVGEFRDKYPQLYQRINVARNRAWLPKVQAMLDGEKSDDTLVVVGSLHLLGEDGLVAMLKAKGYKVERL